MILLILEKTSFFLYFYMNDKATIFVFSILIEIEKY